MTTFSRQNHQKRQKKAVKNRKSIKMIEFAMKTSSDTKTDCRNRKSDLELTKAKGLINFEEHFFSDPGQLPRAVDEAPNFLQN